MKRVITALALALALVVTMSVESFSRVRPYNDPWKPGGDDHPWGGERSIDDPPPASTKANYSVHAITGFVSVDLIFNEIILAKKFRTVFFSFSSVDKSRVYSGALKPNRNVEEQQSSNNKGN